MSGALRILNETRIDVDEAGRRMGTEGKPLHYTSVYRAFNPGRTAPDGGRITLEHLRTGGRLITSVEAVERYMARLNGIDLDAPEAVEAPPRTARPVRRNSRQGRRRAGGGGVLIAQCESPAGQTGGSRHVRQCSTKSGSTVNLYHPSERQEQSPAVDDPTCRGCGGRLRYRGRRRSTTIWECEDPGCPVTLSELHEPCLETPRRRGGGMMGMKAPVGSPGPAVNSNGQAPHQALSDEIRDVTDYLEFLWPTSEDANAAAQAGELICSQWTHPNLGAHVRDKAIVVSHQDTEEARLAALQVTNQCADAGADSVRTWPIPEYGTRVRHHEGMVHTRTACPISWD